MAARVISLRDWVAPRRDWSQAELAQFYRVESALLQSGVALETDRGVTDEGDPWFAFCRRDDGEVFIHFAKLGSEYIVAGPAYEGIARGRSFAGLVEDLIARHPLVQTRPQAGRSNVTYHPAALLIAVVGTAFFKTSEARAEDFDAPVQARRGPPGGAALSQAPSTGRTIVLDAPETLALVASAISVLPGGRLFTPTAESRGLSRLDGTALPVWLATPTQTPGSGSPPTATATSFASAASAVALARPHDVGTLLSLVGVLSDLASAEVSQPAAASAVLSIRTPIPVTEPVLDYVTPTLVVDLTPGPLPDVAAVRFLQRLDGSTELLAQAVTVEQLPTFFSDLIAQGVHVAVVSPAETASLDTSASVQPPVFGDSAEGSPAGLELTPPSDVSADGLQNAGGLASSPPPVHPGVQPEAPPVTSVTTFLTAVQEDQLESAIAHFLANTPSSRTLLNGDDLVMYDARIISDPGLLIHATTVTFNFGDGSSISLIGMPNAVDLATHLPHTG